CVSFHREKFVPKGGPDGGNGGNGGSVYVIGQNNIYLLKKFREQPLVKAESGQPGAKNKKHGANAPDLIIKVPLGTRITNLWDNSQVEILDESSRFLLAKGGKGGFGNWEFRSPTNQTPRQFEPGRPGQNTKYLFELQLIADIGLIGLPNAGKSTLLNALTQAQAKTADYPFTTLEPNLGAFDDYIIADIPGLIEGAHFGKGLGIRFLRHVERTKLLVHCLSCESENLIKDYQIIRQELIAYNPKFVDRPELLILTKADVLDKKTQTKLINQFIKQNLKPLFVSVLLEESLEELKAVMKKMVG
ncbi:hypothetical protein A2262_01250, partial [Candidatus Roizmanbacteria bacterium RIFOXYA2_FULL_41_8]